MDPLTPEDAACLRMLAGANFGPNANVTLPSGRVLTPDEASAYALAAGHAKAPGPPSPAPDDEYLDVSDEESAVGLYLRGGGDPNNERTIALLREGDRGAARRRRSQPKGESEREVPAARPRRRWWKWFR